MQEKNDKFKETDIQTLMDGEEAVNEYLELKAKGHVFKEYDFNRIDGKTVHLKNVPNSIGIATKFPEGQYYVKFQDGSDGTFSPYDLTVIEENQTITENKNNTIMNKTYNNIKDCLLADSDNENDFIYEGKVIYNTENPHKEAWEITGFTKDGVILKHLTKSPLSISKEPTEISFDNIKEMFDKGMIEVDGIAPNDTRVFNLCIKSIQKCMEMKDKEVIISDTSEKLANAEKNVSELSQTISELRAKEQERLDEIAANEKAELEAETLEKIANTARKIKTKKQAKEAIQDAENFTPEELNATIEGAEITLTNMEDGKDKTALQDYVDGLRILSEERSYEGAQYEKGGFIKKWFRHKENEKLPHEFEVFVTRKDGSTDNPIFGSIEAAESAKRDYEKLGYEANITPILENGGEIKPSRNNPIHIYTFLPNKSETQYIGKDQKWYLTSSADNAFNFINEVDIEDATKAIKKNKNHESLEFYKQQCNYEKLSKGGEVCPIGTKIQTLIFDKEHFTKKEAQDWATKHDQMYGIVDEKEHTYHIRQRDPSYFIKNDFRTIELAKGLKAVIGCPKHKTYNNGGNIYLFKANDVVYNKHHNSIGIVRDVFTDGGGDLRTNMDGVVPISDLEIYDSKNPKHKSAEIAPSTILELNKKKFKFEHGGTIPHKFRAAKVTYSDGSHITTSINGTVDEIRNYFRIGSPVNIGQGEHDKMVTIKSVEITDSKLEHGGEVGEYDIMTSKNWWNQTLSINEQKKFLIDNAPKYSLEYINSYPESAHSHLSRSIYDKGDDTILNIWKKEGSPTHSEWLEKQYGYGDLTDKNLGMKIYYKTHPEYKGFKENFGNGGGIQNKSWNRESITDFLNKAGQNVNIEFALQEENENASENLTGRSFGTYGLVTFFVKDNTLHLEFSSELQSKIALGELSSHHGYDVSADFMVSPNELRVSHIDGSILYEKGGAINSSRNFSQHDLNKLTTHGFEATKEGNYWAIIPENGGKILGKFYPEKNLLFVAGKKDLSNPLVKWLKENSYLDSFEEEQYRKGGKIKSIEDETDLLPEVIAQVTAETVAAHNLKSELDKWDSLTKEQKEALDKKYLNKVSEISSYLIDRAETHFKHNESFRKKVKGSGNKGRDYLYMFMRHWGGIVSDNKFSDVSIDTLIKNWEKAKKTHAETFADGGIVGGFEYKTIDLRSEKGFDEAEKLKEEGWKVINTGFDTILMERSKTHINKKEKGGDIETINRIDTANSMWENMRDIFATEKLHSKKLTFPSDKAIDQFIKDFNESEFTEFFFVTKNGDNVIIRKNYKSFAGKKYEKGGHIGFKELVKQVAKEYKRKAVKTKYQKEYGKKQI